jgi:hypothetical protein
LELLLELQPNTPWPVCVARGARFTS